MNRAVSQEEVAIILWLLRNASVAGNLSHLEPSLPRLRVRGGCGCGCPSVDFLVESETVGSTPIAFADGKTECGVPVGIILWAKDNAVSELEIYDLGTPVRTLPLLESLSVSRPA